MVPAAPGSGQITMPYRLPRNGGRVPHAGVSSHRLRTVDLVDIDHIPAVQYGQVNGFPDACDSSRIAPRAYWRRPRSATAAAPAPRASVSVYSGAFILLQVSCGLQGLEHPARCFSGVGDRSQYRSSAPARLSERHTQEPPVLSTRSCPFPLTPVHACSFGAVRLP